MQMTFLFTIKVKNNDVRTPECTDIYVNEGTLVLMGYMVVQEKERKKKEKRKKRSAVSRPNIGMRPRTGSLKNPSYLHKILGNVSSSS